MCKDNLNSETVPKEVVEEVLKYLESLLDDDIENKN